MKNRENNFRNYTEFLCRINVDMSIGLVSLVTTLLLKR